MKLDWIAAQSFWLTFNSWSFREKFHEDLKIARRIIKTAGWRKKRRIMSAYKGVAAVCYEINVVHSPKQKQGILHIPKQLFVRLADHLNELEHLTL